MIPNNLSGFNLIVHIGTGKTGSSSIQKTLLGNKDNLLKQRVVYLGLMLEHAPKVKFSWQKAGQWPEFYKLSSEVRQQQLKKVLFDSINQFHEDGYRRAIWSNESIFGNADVVFPVLKLLHENGIKIDVIVYIRRHDAWARSAYLQWGVKHKTYKGNIKPFRQWFEDQKISFFSGLKPWLDLPWLNMGVRNFDYCSNVVTDFLDFYGLQSSNICLKRENETPNAVALALWAFYNGQAEDCVLPKELYKLFNQVGLLDKMVIDCSFEELLPTEQDIELVRERTQRDRKLINDVLRNYGQPEIDTSKLKEKDMSVSQNQINAALLLIVKHQHNQITSLSNRLGKIETSLYLSERTE